VRFGIFPQELQLLLSDFSRRKIHRPQEGIVVAVREHAQEADHVADFPAPVKFDAAENAVRNLFLNKSFLQRPGKIMCPVQHADAAVRNALVLQRQDFPGDPLRFLLLAFGMEIERLLSARPDRPELLRIAELIIGNDAVSGLQDFRRRTVICIEHDRLRIRELLIEVQKKVHVRSSPGIDRLVRIADDEQVLMLPRKNLRDRVLPKAYVLELVDHHVFHAVLPFRADVRKVLQDIGRKIDQVVEIKAEAFLLFIQIAQEDFLVAVFGRCETRLELVIVQQIEIIDVRLRLHFLSF